jgi:hypothetical protein
MKKIDAVLIAFGFLAILLARGEETEEGAEVSESEFEGAVAGFDTAKEDE